MNKLTSAIAADPPGKIGCIGHDKKQANFELTKLDHVTK